MKKMSIVLGCVALALLIWLLSIFAFSRENILPEVVMADGELFHMEGQRVPVNARIDVIGSVSLVPQDELPEKDGQANIPSAREYGTAGERIVILIEDEWFYCSPMPKE